MKALAVGDRWILALPATPDLFEVVLDEPAIAAFRAAEPDRADGDHHIDPAKIEAGIVSVRTGEQPIFLNAVRIPVEVADEFLALCAGFLDSYPSREALSADTPQAALAANLAMSIRTLADQCCPSEYWKGDCSYGLGNWAKTPWVGLYDTRVTTRASSGVYPVVHFIFDADEGSPTGTPGIRIGLGVSTTEFQGEARLEQVAAVKSGLQRSGALERLADRFWIADSDDRPTMRPVRAGLGRTYYEGMILEQFVTRADLDNGARPSDAIADLVREYSRWADGATNQKPHPFMAAARAYKEDGTVFQSSKRNALYAIGDIHEGSCSVTRLTANDPALCTQDAYDQLITNLEEAQGEASFDSELLSTVAVRTAFLQSSELALSPDRQNVRLVRDDSAAADLLCDYLDQIRANQSGGTPRLYKPAIVSCVLRAVDAGELRDNRVEFDWLVPRFVERMKQLGDPVGEQQAAYAFLHLSNDLFWLLSYGDVTGALDPSAPPSPGAIRTAIKHASIKNTFWNALQSAELRLQVQQRLAAKWWPNERDTPMPAELTDADLNVVLYGPPGTGKTFRTAEMAVKICDGSVPSDRGVLFDRFKELRDEGQVEFVTFHQSYGYEDFVEGIRPILVSDDESDVEATDSEVKYECHDGVFKTLCALARAKTRHVSQSTVDPASVRIWKMSLGNTNNPADAAIYDECIESNCLRLGYGWDAEFTGCDSREAVWARLRERDPEIKSGDYAVTAVNVFKNDMQIGDLVVISDGNQKFRAIGKVTGPYQYKEGAAYRQSRPVEWIVVYEESLPRERISRKGFSQATIYQLRPGVLKIDALREIVGGENDGKRRNYVLIVDELNRGNISKVLGELITLLEPDKRLGRPNELTTTLPYSRDVFGVPDNVYLIGTMNTADRSIAFLDTALRRRFVFREVMPDAGVVRQLVGSKGVVDGVDVGRLLEIVNSRVELLLDRDHQIGHSYFLEVCDLTQLRDVFVTRIIPLLQEYFYGDWSRAAMILGCSFDPDTGTPTNGNNTPILSARLLKTDELLGVDSGEIDDKVSCEISPAFLAATGADLRKFFLGIAGAS